MLAIGKDKVEDLFELAPGICLATKRERVDSYDFDFRNYFPVRTILGEVKSSLILRIGAIHNYQQVYDYFAERGLHLVNSIEQHNNVSLLPNWYRSLQGFTPRSRVFEDIPTYDQLKEDFVFPIFIKGERQTNKHRKELCIAESRSDFEKISNAWKTDPILSWQKMIVREFVDLIPIEAETERQLQKSFEIRVFVWYGNIISFGQYWDSKNKIYIDKNDEDKISELTKMVYERLMTPFMVIDFAKKTNKEWIIIELNDAQESGYAMNAKINLWTRLIETGQGKTMF